MTPSIEVAKKMAQLLDTTVGYLLGEVEQADTFKDPVMLKRLHELLSLPDKDREGILFALDGLLRDAKTRLAYKLKALTFLQGLSIYSMWAISKSKPFSFSSKTIFLNF